MKIEAFMSWGEGFCTWAEGTESKKVYQQEGREKKNADKKPKDARQRGGRRRKNSFHS